jgi:hypothetical protein
VLFNGNVALITPITLTEENLRFAAGDRTFARGLAYAGSVVSARVLGHQVAATVRGTQDYAVLVSLQPPESGDGLPLLLGCQCSCPYSREGSFCKHCVAVGVTIVRYGLFRSDLTVIRSIPPDPGDLLGWLESLSHDDLMSLVVEMNTGDPLWQLRLELRALADARDADGVRDRIGRLLTYGRDSGQGHCADSAPGQYARVILDVSGAIAHLVSAGHAAQAREIAEHAIMLAWQAPERGADESGAITEAVADLAFCHLAACRTGAPDEVALADFLAVVTLSGAGAPAVSFADYAGLLGAAGLATLRDRFTAAWQAPGPAARTGQRALEDLLRLTGDVDGLIAVIQSDTDSGASRYLRIVAELERAGRADEALSWAERGLHASPSGLAGVQRARPPGPAGDPDQRLADFVVRRYAEAGRLPDALDVRRVSFVADRDLAAYRRLRRAAERSGQWPRTRGWALDLLRQDADRPAAAGPGWPRWPAEPVLVDALTDDGDLDAAWDEARGLASEAQWLRLADLIAPVRPADALGVYLRLIAPLRGETGDRAYLRLARLLVSARACHQTLGTEAAFDAYLANVREQQRRKPRLISILDRHQLVPSSAQVS